ncbi:MAG: 3'(2'),5'-bisphosphate nucleotidase CysQ [Rhizobiaceae bacterium]|nr:3'(2'),5'-bisphosphate nucleotidase CysQ [Rhizobiaceae bacterium]
MRLLEQAAGEAGRIAMRFFKQSPEVWMKGGTSPVSEADFAVDRYLREALTSARPDYGWLSEEMTDDHRRLSSRRTFVVDPIDGTRGFLEGSRSWCVSVAIVDRGEPVAGVLECPARAETFSAAAGCQARRNGEVIRVREPGQHPRVSGNKPMIDAMPEPWRSSFERMPYVPSLAYRVAMVASGGIDATFVKPHAHDWDLAACDVILREAGGAILTEAGHAPRYADGDPRHGMLVAGSGLLLKAMAASIATQPLA